MSEEILGKFKENMLELYDKFRGIETKISTVHDQIDEVIQQIEYIKMLAKNEHIID